jgi:hypothetical protein
MKRFLVTGCPRSGTMYTSKVFKGLGVNFGHESVFGLRQGLRGRPANWGEWEGEASWLSVPFLPLDDDTVVLHQVRHPLYFVRSVCGWGFLSDASAGLHYSKVVGLHAPEVYAPDTEPERGATMWRVWNEKAEAHAVMTYRVEDLDAALLLRLCRLIELDVSEEQVTQVLDDLPENVNRRRRDDSVQWQAIEPIVGEAAARYGY